MGEALAEELQTEVAFTSAVRRNPVHESIVVMWGIMAFVMIAVLLLTRNLKIVPGQWAGSARICGNVGEQFLGRQHGQSR